MNLGSFILKNMDTEMDIYILINIFVCIYIYIVGIFNFFKAYSMFSK